MDLPNQFAKSVSNGNYTSVVSYSLSSPPYLYMSATVGWWNPTVGRC